MTTQHGKLTAAQLHAAIASVFGGSLTAKPIQPAKTAQTVRVKDQTTNLLAARAKRRREETATIPVATVSLFRRQRCGCCGQEPWALEGEYVSYRNAAGTETRLSRETVVASIAQALPHEVLWEQDARAITMCAACATLSTNVNDLLATLDLSTVDGGEQLELWL